MAFVCKRMTPRWELTTEVLSVSCGLESCDAQPGQII